jgi:NitT/TauT family transport system substrate-binding protein
MRPLAEPGRTARLLLAAVFVLLASLPAQAADRLILRLSNIRQAQFAGYYVAQARGLYAAAGLDVRIEPGAPDGDDGPPKLGADVWSAWLPAALAARRQGLDLVNIAQIFPHSGLELICRKSSKIHAPMDFKGHTIAVWQDGSQIPFLAWMQKLGFSVPGDVTMLKMARTQGDAAIAPLLDHTAACITALSYDQYWSVIAAGMRASDLQVFHYGNTGFAPLQDGLYIAEASFDDPARRAILTRFLRASLQGWAWAITHQTEAVAIVIGNTPTTPAETLRQTRMMSTAARLTDDGLNRLGYLEPLAFERTVKLLLDAPPPRPIDRPPAGAWSHSLWDRAASRPKQHG